jgi:hypothetical protein
MQSARLGCTPVVTGSMRNRVSPQGIEAPRGAYDGVSDEWRVASGEKNRRKLVPPLPLGFSQVLILQRVKVFCFDTLLQVLLLKVFKIAVSVELGRNRRKG